MEMKKIALIAVDIENSLGDVRWWDLTSFPLKDQPEATTSAVSLFIIFFTCPTYSEQKHVYLELSWQLETSIKEPS